MQSHAARLVSEQHEYIFVVIYTEHLNSKQKLSLDILIAAIELF